MLSLFSDNDSQYYLFEYIIFKTLHPTPTPSSNCHLLGAAYQLRGTCLACPLY